MTKLRQRASQLLTRMRGENGQTLGEYGVLVTVIAIVVVVAVVVLGADISSLFVPLIRDF